jgi:hypothetical protein
MVIVPRKFPSQEEVSTLRRKLFDKAGRNPRKWYSKAMQLYNAAKALEDRVKYESYQGKELPIVPPNMEERIKCVYFMLSGFAIENLFKGILVNRGQSCVSDGKLIVKHWGKNHRLVNLANLSELTLLPEDTLLLEILTQYILWAGRYPIPQSYVEGVLVNEQGHHLPVSLMTAGFDLKQIDTLVSKLREILEKEMGPEIF